MKTEIFDINPSNIDQNKIDRAANIIKNGGLVAFPTETVYGLGADATDSSAAQKIYSAKGRPSDNPLIIHIATPADAEIYAHTSKLYYKLAAAFMPGPLTIILPKKDTIPSEVTGGLDTVAVRCPSHEIARELIKSAGVAIAAPSANISGSPSPTCFEHVFKDMDGKIEAIISGGSSDIGLESTIVKLDGEKATLLRPGAITVDALECVCEKVEIAHSVTEMLKENERPLSPGMKYRHYAPSIPLVLLDGEHSKVLAFIKKQQLENKVAIICYDEDIAELQKENLISIGASNDLNAQARNLFSALREADKLKVDIIYAHLPSRQGIGLALYNRLIRAAAHTVMTVK